MTEPLGRPTEPDAATDDHRSTNWALDDQRLADPTPDDQILMISAGERLLACIVRASYQPNRTTFVTDPAAPQQLGFVVGATGAEIQPHLHGPVERRLRGTSETVIVRSGECEVDIFTSDGVPVATHTLRTGDVVVLLDGGHGFRMRVDTVLLEVKQGPYLGYADKRSLDPLHRADCSRDLGHGDETAGAPADEPIESRDTG